MTREEALKIWEDIYGREKWAQDCFGTWMYKDDYGDYDKYRIRPNGTGQKYQYGWEIDHIRPRSDFKIETEADFLNNYEPVHYMNNRKKSDEKRFSIRNKQYRIVECDICKKNGVKGYGIENTETKERVDWKYVQNAYYEE